MQGAAKSYIIYDEKKRLKISKQHKKIDISIKNIIPPSPVFVNRHIRGSFQSQKFHQGGFLLTFSNLCVILDARIIILKEGQQHESFCTKKNIH